jgi:hypothetical protein
VQSASGEGYSKLAGDLSRPGSLWPGCPPRYGLQNEEVPKPQANESTKGRPCFTS